MDYTLQRNVIVFFKSEFLLGQVAIIFPPCPCKASVMANQYPRIKVT
jgi:hypothetical protein